MPRRNKWMIALLIIAGLQVSACTQKTSVATAEKPAHVDAIEGSTLKRVTLTEKARERPAIETAPVREEQVARKRRVGGEVVGSPAATGAVASDGSVWVRVRLNESDLNQVDGSQPTRVLSLSNTDSEDADDIGVDAEAEEGIADDAEESVGTKALYYVVRAKDHGLKVGQRALVELTLKSDTKTHKAIPYSAVIYDAKGKTWAYTNPEGLVYLRAPIVVDYIAGQTAYLTEGPEAGMAVVTNGVAELYGAETGVGK